MTIPITKVKIALFLIAVNRAPSKNYFILLFPEGRQVGLGQEAVEA